MITLRRRVEKLERAAQAQGLDVPLVLTEAEWDDLTDEQMIAFLRGRLNIRVISEDPGPSWDEHMQAAGVNVTEALARPGAPEHERALEEHKKYMDACLARSQARGQARKAAREAAGAAST